MEKPIRIRILGREYTLRVRDEDEALTRTIATYVDAKMRAFRKSHPDQPEITTAVITALAIAEELHTAQEQHTRFDAALDEEASRLERRLAGVLEHLATAPAGHRNGREETPDPEAPLD